MSEVQASFDVIIDALIAQQTMATPRAYMAELDRLRTEFATSRAAVDALSAAGKQSDTNKANMAKAAKALPDIAKSLKNVIQAFDNGDRLEGSACIMDICATVANLLGSMAAASSAGGPIGALIGSVFGMVGMILRMFQPAQKSLGDVLEGKLRLITAENIGISLQTAIDELESLYAGYPKKGPVKIKSSQLNSLAEGNAADHVFSAGNWLLKKGNIDERSIFNEWLGVLEAYLHAQCLQRRNLTYLLSIASEESYADLDGASTQIAKQHLGKMRRLQPTVRDKGVVWHIGILPGRNIEGGGLYKRQGGTGEADWTELGGQQQEFCITKDAQTEARHVIALHGYQRGTWLRAVDGKWPNSDWQELQMFLGCVDAAVMPRRKSGDVDAYLIRGNHVGLWALTREKDRVGVTNDTRHSGFNPVPEGVTLERIRLLNGFNGDEPGATGYVLFKKDGKHQILCAALPKTKAPVLTPPWPVINGIGVDDSHLWVWTRDHIGCLSHAQIRERVASNATEEQWKKAWLQHTIGKSTVLETDESGAGLTYLCPAADGTLMVTYNLKLFSGVPHASKTDGQFNVEWTRLDPTARGTRILKEPLDCFALFAQQLESMEALADEPDRKLHWDKTLR